MKRIYLFIAMTVVCATSLMAQDDHIIDGLTSVATIAGETKTADSPQVSQSVDSLKVEIPIWKQKLFYGYKFDIYYHQDTRNATKENGYSIVLTPEIGWRVKEKLYVGLRIGGGYQNTYASYEALDGKTEELRIHQGSWDVTPYVRYRLKTLFNDKVGVWLEGHLYAGMEYPRVTEGVAEGTDYEGLRHTITYGAQVSPVITYQFNKKSTFQIFFSIISIGYSGTTFCYTDPKDNRFTNDVIIFSGKLRNLIANQFTPGLYGLRLGVQKSF